jgi:ketosteroid isomerase-like protein
MNENKFESISIEDVINLQKAVADAMINRDINTLERLLSDDLLQVHGGGTVQNKKSFIHNRKNPDGIKYKVINSYDVEVKLFPKCVLVRGNLDVLEFIPGYGDVEGRVRFSSVWAEEKDGAWRCIHSQSTNRTAKTAQ